MDVGLSGAAVIVTGAASGIGRTVATLAAEAGPVKLLLTDMDEAGCETTAETCRGMGAEVATIAANLSEPDVAGRIAGACREVFGRIDGLVNAAALNTRAHFLDADIETFDLLFAVNARAPFFLMAEAIRDMTGRGAPGAIVNILSINAHCGLPELAIYSGTKGALSTLTKNAANAHLADRIRVNGINLGWTSTEGEEKTQSEDLGKGEDWKEAIADLPLGRLVRPEECARMTLWLLSDASVPQTGTVTDLEQRVLGAFD